MYYEVYYFALIPFAVLVFILSFFALDKLLLFIVFMVPLSVPLRELVPGLPIDFYIPTEPLLFGILIIFIFKLLIKNNFDKQVLKHPVTLAIFFSLAWILITSITSTMPVVSLKFLLARMWFLAAFYFIATQLFKQKRYIKSYILLYSIPFVFVMGYTFYRHVSIGLFDQKAAHWVMSPFFNDHTSYGAMIAMFIPVLLGLSFKSNYSQTQKLFIRIMTLIFIFSIVLSYSRAAWLSLMAVLGIWLIIKLKIKLRTLIMSALVLGFIILSFWSTIIIQLSKNKQDSSQNIEKHFESMSNIQTDASNLERLNRWNSAFRMFREKPIFGWGPGTYSFQYASFQFSYEKTIISTNAGNMGNAHSEYIGPLAESGIFGTLSFLLILVTSIYTGLRVVRRTKDKELRTLALGILLGLITYFLHGFLNNFLDTDKASATFWGFIAMIVAIDLYHKEKLELEHNEG